MPAPSVEKGGKEAREYAAKLRKRAKKGTCSDEDSAWLSLWDARIATLPKGRPTKERAAAEAANSQPGSESTPGGGGDQTEVPHVPRTEPSASPPPANPDLEAAPRVAPNVAAQDAPSDWRTPHRNRCKFSDDGRQMLCESIADAWADGLGALVDDMKKAGMDAPMGLDPRLPNIKSMAVLAFDELLPDRARLTPKVATIIITTAVVGKRAIKHKAITEALKTDPDTIAWKKKQAEREAKEQLERAAHDAEVAAANATPAAPPAQPTHAEPPPPPEPPPPANGARPKSGQPFSGRSTRAKPIDDGMPVL
jgi:hypothetical protein